MKINKRYTRVCLIALILSGTLVGFRWLGRRAAFAQIKSAAPKASRYVQFKEVSAMGEQLSSTVPPRATLGFDAVRSDGAYVYGRYFIRSLNGQTYLSRRIIFPETGRRIIVQDDTQSITTTYLPESHPSRYNALSLDPNKGCLDYRSPAYRRLGAVTKERTVYLGIPVVVVLFNIDEHTSTTQWLAPSLDCQVMRSLFEKRDPTTRELVDRSEQTAINVQIGEPPAELFDVPAYTERSPIGAEEEYFRRFKNGVIDPALYSTRERQEKIYRDLQRPR